MRTLYFLVFNHKCYVTTSLAEIQGFATFMGLEGQIQTRAETEYYYPKIEKL